MKYLREFENEAAYSAYTQSEDYITPNVCLLETEKAIRMNKYVEPPLPPYVDLGLPSGLKWAKCNVGASSPEEDGLYFSWGNTEGHAKDSGYSFDSTNYASTPGAAVSADLTTSNDAASVILGNGWRMPTKTEFEELYNSTYNQWVSDFDGTGVAGRKFMKTSDHSVFIFLPASGLYQDTTLKVYGSSGGYWSNSLHTDNSRAYILSFSSNPPTINNGNSNRYLGRTIRAVK
jgi:uncharacterized protein (TIGR02145 family)